MLCRFSAAERQGARVEIAMVRSERAGDATQNAGMGLRAQVALDVFGGDLVWDVFEDRALRSEVHAHAGISDAACAG